MTDLFPIPRPPTWWARYEGVKHLITVKPDQTGYDTRKADQEIARRLRLAEDLANKNRPAGKYYRPSEEMLKVVGVPPVVIHEYLARPLRENEILSRGDPHAI